MHAPLHTHIYFSQSGMLCNNLISPFPKLRKWTDFAAVPLSVKRDAHERPAAIRAKLKRQPGQSMLHPQTTCNRQIQKTIAKPWVLRGAATGCTSHDASHAQTHLLSTSSTLYPLHCNHFILLPSSLLRSTLYPATVLPCYPPTLLTSTLPPFHPSTLSTLSTFSTFSTLSTRSTLSALPFLPFLPFLPCLLILPCLPCLPFLHLYPSTFYPLPFYLAIHLLPSTLYPYSALSLLWASLLCSNLLHSRLLYSSLSSPTLSAPYSILFSSLFSHLCNTQVSLTSVYACWKLEMPPRLARSMHLFKHSAL